MSKHKPYVAAAAAVLLLSSSAAIAQDAGSTTRPPRSGQTPGTTSTGKTDEPTSTSALSGKDKSFVKEAAIGGIAEVQLGRLASEKAVSPDVKQFAQQIVDDHSKANDQLTALAKQKNIDVPAELTGKPASAFKRLSNLSGPDFDREYMKLMLDDHKKEVSGFRRQSEKSEDADLKAFAMETLPTLEAHLVTAQRLAPAKPETRGTSGTGPPSGPTDGGPIGPGAPGRPGTGDPNVPGRPGTGDPGAPGRPPGPDGPTPR
jgi:putative membrane protein